MHIIYNRYEPPRDKTNNVAVRPAKTQISLGIQKDLFSICPVWSESSLCAQWVAKGPSFLHADNEDSDQTGRMPRLNWVFAGRTLTLLVLSRGGSYNFSLTSICYNAIIYINEPQQDKKQNKMTCVPNEDSDQPGLGNGLIRVFTVHCRVS